jgi:hypothetical protein
MPWFYVDDGFSDSKPVLNMPDRHRLAACGLWVLAGSWSAKEELDGFVPNSKLRQLGARPTILAALTDKGPMFAPLCEQTSDGIQFNSWKKWQKTREELAEKRREDAERQRLWREAHPDAKPGRKSKGRGSTTSVNADVSQRDNPVTNSVTNGENDGDFEGVSQRDLARTGARPDPTRPDPTHISNGYVESAAYESDATRERNDLSPPVNVGATRLVERTIPANAVNASTRTGLRIEASQLLAGGESETDVAACLQLWLTKPDLGVKALKSLMAEVYKTRNGAVSKPTSKIRSLVDLAREQRAIEQSEIEPVAVRKELT